MATDEAGWVQEVGQNWGNVQILDDEDDLSPSVAKPFVHIPYPGSGLYMMTTDRGARDAHIAKALLDSIILLKDLEEYVTASKQQLIDQYTKL